WRAPLAPKGSGGRIPEEVRRCLVPFPAPRSLPSRPSSVPLRRSRSRPRKAASPERAGSSGACPGPGATSRAARCGSPPTGSRGRRPDFLLLGVIVEAPEGLVCFKLTGPAATVGAAQADFDALVASFAKG